MKEQYNNYDWGIKLATMNMPTCIVKKLILPCLRLVVVTHFTFKFKSKTRVIAFPKCLHKKKPKGKNPFRAREDTSRRKQLTLLCTAVLGLSKMCVVGPSLGIRNS